VRDRERTEKARHERERERDPRAERESRRREAEREGERTTWRNMSEGDRGDMGGGGVSE
jgi:hypothetical protein